VHRDLPSPTCGPAGTKTWNGSLVEERPCDARRIERQRAIAAVDAAALQRTLEVLGQVIPFDVHGTAAQELVQRRE